MENTTPILPVNLNGIAFQLFNNCNFSIPSVEVTFEDLSRMIRSDLLVKSNTEEARRLRAQGDIEGYKNKKKECKALMVGGRATGRRRMENIKEMTGLAMADIDGIKDDEQLQQALALVRDDPHTAMAWVTHSGLGIRILFCGRFADGHTVPTDSDEYNSLWLTGNEYYEQLTGLPVDRQTSGANHLTQLAHDPDVMVRSEAMPFLVPETKKKDKPLRVTAPTAWVEHGQDPLSTAQRFVEQCGVWYEEHHHNEFVSRMAFQLNRYGVDADEAARLLVNAGFMDGNAHNTEAVVRNVYRNHGAEHATLAHLLSTRRPGRPRGSGIRKNKNSNDMENNNNTSANSRVNRTDAAMTFIDEHYDYRHNTVLRNIEIREHGTGPYLPLDNMMLNTITNRICLESPVNVTENTVLRILFSDFSPLYNPFEHYLNGLPPWDGHDHLGDLLARIDTTADADLLRHYFGRFLVSMVDTMLGRGINQMMLVLSGPQRIGKSTLAERLLPPELHGYYDTMPPVTRTDKDTLVKLANNALISIEEYTGQNGRTPDIVKGLIRTTVINQRNPYERVESAFRRYASFMATTNEQFILADTTGNECIFPFEVTAIGRIDEDHPIDYAGLYSQLLHMADHPDGLLEDDPTMKQRYDLYRRRFEVPVAEEELLLTHYRPATDDERKYNHATLLTASEITAFINRVDFVRLSIVKTGQALVKLGFTYRTSHNQRRYEVVPIDNPLQESSNQ